MRRKGLYDSLKGRDHIHLHAYKSKAAYELPDSVVEQQGQPDAPAQSLQSYSLMALVASISAASYLLMSYPLSFS